MMHCSKQMHTVPVSSLIELITWMRLIARLCFGEFGFKVKLQNVCVSLFLIWGHKGTALPGHQQPCYWLVIINSSPPGAPVNWVSIGSDNGLLPSQHQAIIWTNVGLLSIGPLGTNMSEFFIKIQNFSFMKMLLKISAAKWRPFCPGGDELMGPYLP